MLSSKTTAITHNSLKWLSRTTFSSEKVQYVFVFRTVMMFFNIYNSERMAVCTSANVKYYVINSLCWSTFALTM